jgi:hypothetical protein
LQHQITSDLIPMLWTAKIPFNLKEIYDFILSLQVAIVH